MVSFGHGAERRRSQRDPPAKNASGSLQAKTLVRDGIALLEGTSVGNQEVA